MVGIGTTVWVRCFDPILPSYEHWLLASINARLSLAKVIKSEGETLANILAT